MQIYRSRDGRMKIAVGVQGEWQSAWRQGDFLPLIKQRSMQRGYRILGIDTNDGLCTSEGRREDHRLQNRSTNDS